MLNIVLIWSKKGVFIKFVSKNIRFHLLPRGRNTVYFLFLTGAKLRNSNGGAVTKKAQSFRFLAQNDSFRHLYSVFTQFLWRFPEMFLAKL